MTFDLCDLDNLNSFSQSRHFQRSPCYEEFSIEGMLLYYFRSLEDDRPRMSWSGDTGSIWLKPYKAVMYFYLTARLVPIWLLNLHGEILTDSETNGEIQIFQQKNFNILPKVIIKRKDKHSGMYMKVHTFYRGVILGLLSF